MYITKEELADSTGATLVGTADNLTVQQGLDARPTSATLAATGGADEIGFEAEGTGAVGWSVGPRLREAFVSPGDFGAPEGGAANAQAELVLAVQAAADFKRPLLINGVYRLDSALPLVSNLSITGAGALRANHNGSMLTNGAVDQLNRVTIDGIRLEAAATVAKAIDGSRWQYCRLANLRFVTAGGVFEQVFYFDDSAYWNNCENIEIESGINCFDLGDANNLVLSNINWIRNPDIGMKTFLKFHSGCSAISGNGLSIEGVFNDTTLVELSGGVYGLDLQFIRVEGRDGSSNVRFMDFGGSKGNFVQLPAALYGIDAGVLANEAGNWIAYQDSLGGGLIRMGSGRALAPVSASDPDVAGTFNYQTTMNRLRGNVGGARSFFFTPAVDPLDMNGHAITGVQNLQLRDGVADPGVGTGVAVMFVDSADGDLKIRFSDGTLKTIVTD